MKVTLKQVEGAKISFIFSLCSAIVVLFTVPFLLIFGLILKNDLSAFDFIVFIFLPAIYFIFIYIFSRIFFGVFGMILKKYNGFEIEVDNLQKDEIN